MDTDSLIVFIKADDIFKDITEDVETRFDTSSYELECISIEIPLPKGKDEKVIGPIKDELDKNIMIRFVRLRAKIYRRRNEDKKAKETKQKRQKMSVVKTLNLKIKKTV